MNDSRAATGTPGPALLLSRRFGPLFGTQFLGAFNDNLLKQALMTLVTFRLAGANASMVNNLAAALFILPFLFFSPLSGQLAERWPKPRVAQGVKVAEVLIMLVAGAGFWLSSVPLLLVALALMGVHSAVFGPVKYGVLPELVPERELTTANAWIAAGTFLAILLGNVGGIQMVERAGADWEPALWLAIVALLGLGCALSIPALPAAAPSRALDFHPWRELKSSLAFLRHERDAIAALAGINWFWFVGVAYLSQLPVLARDVAHVGTGGYTAMLLAFSLGIGAGALLCDLAARGRVVPRIAVVGAIAMCIGAAELVRLCIAGDPPEPWLLAVLAFLGTGAGLYIVPLYTVLQVKSPADSRARTFAATNLLNSLAMVLSSMLAIVLLVVMTLPLWVLFAVLLAGTLGVAVFLARMLR